MKTNGNVKADLFFLGLAALRESAETVDTSCFEDGTKGILDSLIEGVVREICNAELFAQWAAGNGKLKEAK